MVKKTKRRPTKSARKSTRRAAPRRETAGFKIFSEIMSDVAGEVTKLRQMIQELRELVEAKLGPGEPVDTMPGGGSTPVVGDLEDDGDEPQAAA